MNILNSFFNFFNGKNSTNSINVGANMNNQSLVNKEFKFENITSIVNDTIFDVALDNNPINKSDFATLEAPEDQINKIHLVEQNGTLVISSSAVNESFGNIKITLQTHNLAKIKNSSAGELDGNFIGNSLDLKNLGTGNISLSGKSDFIDIFNNSAGKFNGNFISNNINIKNSGTGDINFNGSADSVQVENNSAGEFTGNLECDFLKIENSGTGDINIVGSANSVKMENTSAGEVNLFKLKAEKVDFYASGTGDIEIYATKEILGKSTGVGNVTYSGIKNVFIQNTGVGSVDYRD
jgi:hypothetical protein